jgi:site-specific recombinase XerD
MPSENRDRAEILTTDAISARVEHFLSSLYSEKSSATRKTYGRALGVFTLWVDEQGGKVQLSRESLQDYLLYLQRVRKVKDRTIQTYLTAVRQFFAFLSEKGLLQKDPSKGLKVKVSASAGSRGILTMDEVEHLLQISKSSDPIDLRDRAILRCMLIEGLSEGEVVRCNYKDLEHTLMGEELVVRGKGGRLRVPLDARTYKSIVAYLSSRIEYIRYTGPLFVSHGPRGQNERLKVRSVRARMRVLLDQAGIRRLDVSPQSLTHTSIYLLIQKGVSRAELRQRTRPWRLFHRINDLKAKELIDASY